MLRVNKNDLLILGGTALGTLLPLSLAALFAVLAYETAATLSVSNAKPTLLGRWLPAENKFGFLDLFVSTGFAAMPATLLAVGLGTLAALAIFLETGRREALAAEFSLSVWAGFPSVVVGILLLNAVTPVLGYSLATATLAITAMVLPPYTLAVLALLRQSDTDELLAAQANGLTNLHLVRQVLFPRNRRQLAGLAMLTFGRSIGEATCVAIVSGGIIRSLPPGLFDTINTMSTAILRGFPVAGGSHEAAVYSAALVLLLLVTASALAGSYLRLRRTDTRSSAQSSVKDIADAVSERNR